MENLQTVLQFLNDPEAPVEDPVALLQAFARSTAAAKPWLVDNQFQALQNSGRVRLVRKLEPDSNLAGLYEGTDVLFSQIERIQGAYPIVVNGLIPAQLQAAFSQLSGYAQSTDAPPLADNDDLQHAIGIIRTRRIELLGQARNEAAVATAWWYALSRIKRDLEAVLQSLAQWDRSPNSVAEDLVDCVKPRSS